MDLRTRGGGRVSWDKVREWLGDEHELLFRAWGSPGRHPFIALGCVLGVALGM